MADNYSYLFPEDYYRCFMCRPHILSIPYSMICNCDTKKTITCWTIRNCLEREAYIISIISVSCFCISIIKHRKFLLCTPHFKINGRQSITAISFQKINYRPFTCSPIFSAYLTQWFATKTITCWTKELEAYNINISVISVRASI